MSLCGQENRDALLDRAIAKIRASTHRPADYLCTETMERAFVPPRHPMPAETVLAGGSCGWWPDTGDHFRPFTSDRIRVDVLSTDHGELYGWPGEQQFQTDDVLRMMRAHWISAEGFNGFLRSIFDGPTIFRYAGDVQQNGQSFREYSFSVPKERSAYWFLRGPMQVIVAIEGTFLLNPETADLARISIQSSSPPKANDICGMTTMLDYGHIDVNGVEVFVPSSAVFDVATISGTEFRNSSVYSACHEFTGISKLRDDAADLTPSEQGTTKQGKAAGLPKLSLPEGLTFSVAFTQDVPLRTVAAGDIVPAQLIKPIRDSSKRILAPAGTPIAVRILGVDSVHDSGAFGASLVFRVEALTTGGTTYSFAATFTQRVDGAPHAYATNEAPLSVGRTAVGEKSIGMPPVNSIQDSDIGRFLYSPNTAVLQFYQIRPDFVLKAGKHPTQWRTGGNGVPAACQSAMVPCR